jgi:hypothetical protein
MEGAYVKPLLVSTDVAATFIVRCRDEELTAETLRSARDHIYYAAKKGYITRHGNPKRGQALWDLHELVKPYRQTTQIVLP